jgi:hypothetical protein
MDIFFLPGSRVREDLNFKRTSKKGKPDEGGSSRIVALGHKT